MSEIRITGFEMIEKIGEGGMASVWKARQVSLDRIVAIKILSSRLASDPEDVTRFQAEAQAAARLKHSGIVQVYDANIEHGLYFFVMEYVAGYTVGAWLRRKEVLQEKDALLVAECVADALGYAWESARIVHCDIKPENVMVNSDGTVKVADLGLARTISAMTIAADSDEVMGTPPYVSPEQAAGKGDLDYRADIYSLGAMLYHLVTGKMLFEGNPDDRIMDMHATETVPNPFDLNPGLSRGICHLIEKMLAKDPSDRYDSWDAVRKNVARVRKGMLPKQVLSREASSTVRSSDRLKTARYHRAAGEPRKRKSDASERKIKVAILGGIVLIVALVMGYSIARKPDVPRETPAPAPVPAPPPAPVAEKETPEDKAREIYELAVEWAAKHPEDYDDVVKRFEWVATQTKDTKYSGMAKEEARKATAAKRTRINAILAGLRREALALSRSGDFAAGIDVYESYAGPLEEETRQARLAAVTMLRRRQRQVGEREAAERRRAEELSMRKCAEAVMKAAKRLLSEGPAEARAVMAEAMGDPDLATKVSELKAIDELIDGLKRIDSFILDSFVVQVGKKVTVHLRRGPVQYVIVGVKNGKVKANRKLDVAGARATDTFGVEDLAPREKLARMGSEEKFPEVALAKGLMAYEAKAYGRAKDYFVLTYSRLGDRLVESVEALEKGTREEGAKEALAQLLRSVGVRVGPYNADAWVASVRRKTFPLDAAPKISEAVGTYRQKYGRTSFGKGAEPILEALIARLPRAKEEEARRGPGRKQELPRHLEAIEGNGEAVLNLLLRKNGQLFAEQVNMIPDPQGRITGLEILTESIENIGPVAALTDLKTISCRVRGQQAQLKDLSPLANLGLESVTIRNCRVHNLDFVEDMPLKQLDLADTNVRDISALKKTQITWLNLAGSRVFDFSGLSRVPLSYLNLSRCQIKDVGFLKGMQIQHLELADSRVHDFSPISHLPKLKHLNLNQTQIRDIDLLKKLPLQTLHLNATGISDISPLEGMKLRVLDLGNTAVADFSILQGQPLVHLVLSGTRFKDIGLLNGMPLVRLDLSSSRADDLWALKGMELSHLNIRNTKISDVTPLAGMPLVSLDCRQTKIKKLDAVSGAPIQVLLVDKPEEHSHVIRSLRQLVELNGVDIRKNRRFLDQVLRGKGRR